MGFGTGFNFPLGVIFAGIDQLTGPMAKMESGLTRFGTQAIKVGKGLTAGLSVPLLAAGGFSINTAAQFEKGMNRILALTSASEDEVVGLERRARDLGKSTQFTARQVADAMGFMAQGGFKVGQIFDGIEPVLQLAAAGELDIANAAEIATLTLEGYGLEVQDLTRVVDLLAAGQAQGVTNVEQLGIAFGRGGPVAHAFGVRIEEATGILTSLATAGYQAELGGTALKMMLVGLADPSVKAALSGLGVDLGRIFNAEGKVESMVETFQAFRDAGLDGIQAIQIFGAKAGPAVAALLGRPENELRDMLALMDASAGEGKRMQDIMMRGAVGSTLRFQSALEGLQIATAESGLLESFTNLTERAAAFVTRLEAADPEMLNTIVKLGLVAAAVGPVLFVVGQLAIGLGSIAAIGAFIGPVVGAVTAGVIGLAAAGAFLIYKWDSVKEWFGDFWLGLRIKASEFFDWYAEKLGWVGREMFGLDRMSSVSTTDLKQQLDLRKLDRERRLEAAAVRGDSVHRQEQRVEVSLQGLPPGSTVRTFGDGIAALEVGRLMGAN